jgi:hypothetical protein
MRYPDAFEAPRSRPSIAFFGLRREASAALTRVIFIAACGGVELDVAARAKKVWGPVESGAAGSSQRQDGHRPPEIDGDRTMRVMVLVKATKDSEAGMKPSPELTDMFEAMGKFNEELVNAGVMLAGDGLKPSSQGKRVAFDGPGRTVIDGPFAETRELVAGYWLWEVKDMAEAVEWVKRCPNPMPGPSEIEIRPLYEMSDFAEILKPETADRIERNREKLEDR